MPEEPAKSDTRSHARHVRVDITWRSIFRILAGALAGYSAIILWPLLELLVLAALVATALYPIVTWVRQRGWPRWVGLLLSSTVLLAIVLGCFAVIGPLAYRQLSMLGQNLPRLKEEVLQQLPPNGALHAVIQNAMGSGTVENSQIALERIVAVAQTTLEGLAHFVVVIILSIYLMADGPQAIKWTIVFFPMDQRDRITLALRQVSDLISSYVAGQFLVCIFAAVFMFLLLEILGVPMALLLGMVAGICDILPIIGVCIALLLSMAIGLTVSPTIAVIIFVVYGAYHLFENFFIVPRVYGRRLKLSKLAVPLAIAAGGLLAGVVGAIAVLPIVAAYPVVEQRWLAPRLAPDTLKAHQEE